MLIDDHPVVLNGLKNLFNAEGNIEIVAEASDGKDALLLLEELKVDIVIADISMPEMDGIELTIILTAFNEREILKKAFQSGAEACLLKSTSRKELLLALYKVLDNGYYYCDEILQIARDIHKDLGSELEEHISISKRELEVFELVLQGFSNKEIAEKLFVSYHTVCSHRKNVMRKTNSRNISDLFNFARRNKLFSFLQG